MKNFFESDLDGEDFNKSVEELALMNYKIQGNKLSSLHSNIPEKAKSMCLISEVSAILSGLIRGMYENSDTFEDDFENLVSNMEKYIKEHSKEKHDEK